MKSLVKFPRTARIATLAAAATLSFGSSLALAGEGNDADMAAAKASDLYVPGTISRAEVREELAVARSGGLLTAPGQISEPTAVLVARASFNEQQAQTLTARYQAEYERQVAAVEEEVRRQQMAALDSTSEYPYETALVGSDPLGVQVDVIRIDTNTLTTRPEEVVVVAVSDTADPELQLQRAEEVRWQLIAMGLEPRQIYLEASGTPETIGN